MRRILITGVHSYIGNAAERHLLKRGCGEEGGASYLVRKVSLREPGWESAFAAADGMPYDTVLHVAGKAHADVEALSEEQQAEYYRVNRDLAVEAAGCARNAGIRQFIYLSSVIVYGDSAPVGGTKRITADTSPAPANFYGESKLLAEEALQELADESFRVAIVRAPMIYGRGSRGNFPQLVRLAEKLPVFPRIGNQRSVLYVENLCEFLRLLAESGEGGIFFPQNAEYAATEELVRLIAGAKGRRIIITGVLNPLVRLAGKCPGRVGALARKAFGSLTVDQELSASGDIGEYRLFSLEESIERSLGGTDAV